MGKGSGSGTHGRRAELTKLLTKLRDPNVDVKDVADQLDRMFSDIESERDDAKKGAKSAREEHEDSIIKVNLQYESVTDSLKSAPEKLKKMYKDIFDTYEAELTRSLQATQELIPVINTITMQQNKTFADYKGMSLDAMANAQKLPSLLAGIQKDMLGLYSTEEMREEVTRLTRTFVESFPQIRFQTAENEKEYFKMGMSLKKLNVDHETSANFFQATTSRLKLMPAEINQVTNGFLEIQKVTGRPLEESLKSFNHYVDKLGYGAEEAFRAVSKLSVAQQKTGISTNELGNIFGDQMDTFDDLAEKTATLNATFGVSLNPQEMVDMTADQRMAYITEALKESNVDLNDRLIQKQVASVYGGQENARKYLASINETNSQVASNISKTEAKVADIRLGNMSKTTAAQRKQAEAQMSDVERLRLLQEQAAAIGRARAASGGLKEGETREQQLARGADQVETDAYASFRLKTAGKAEVMQNLITTEAGQNILELSQVYRRARALIGDNIVGTLVGVTDTTQKISLSAMMKARENLLIKKQTEGEAALSAAEKSFLAETDKAKFNTDTISQEVTKVIAAAAEGSEERVRAELTKYMETDRLENINESAARIKREGGAAAGGVWEDVKTAFKEQTDGLKKTLTGMKHIKVIIENTDGMVLAHGRTTGATTP